MRPFKPAPKNASANRIRERYLHQLGLQRGAGAPLSAPVPDEGHRVVVISGLPSLPEDRATTTTEHVMESHDFSITQNSQGTGDSGGGGCEPVVHVRTIPAHPPGACGEPTARYNRARLNSADSSVLSVDSGLGSEACEALTSMALPPPGMVLHTPTKPPAPPGPYHFRTSGSALSKPAFILLNDGDSVSSQGTNTTAGESSFTTTRTSMSLVGRDWGANPQSCNASVSPQEVRGVHFLHARHGTVKSSGANVMPIYPGVGCGGGSGGAGCPPATASSLASALGRFNIDSDRDDCSHGTHDDDEMSQASDGSSWTSGVSCGAASARRKKKGSRAARLMDRAKSHERILRIRSEGSARMRASVVGMQRMGGPAPMAMQQGTGCSPPGSPGNSSCGGSQQSVPLVHVCHGPQAPSADDGRDLGRTPTASNCSDLRPYRHPALVMPPGVYQGPVAPCAGGGASVAGSDWSVGSGATEGNMSCGASLGRPMRAHPRLVRDVPPPPGPGCPLPGGTRVETMDHGVPQPPRSPFESPYGQAGMVDDAEVLEVARTLSMLGGRPLASPGIVPRIR